MSLSVGARLGVYEILARIGAGGMGEVYRARDTNLSRDVAIKVLPEEVATDGERLARFKREAQLLAALNHPGIAAIHGLEMAGDQPFLVMELVEGQDLAERLKRGAIPVDEALPIARQIAEALEEAHERGIVHRDLKPANIKLTPEGRVKVLDFGLARAYSDDVEGRGQSDVSHSPTLTRGTQVGVILGTAAYMSPEQARGKPVDRRADVWAFGVVLYEMLTGKKVFEGEAVSDTLASVLKTEPDWAALPAETPEWTRELMRRCLARDPRERLRDIGHARQELERMPGAAPVKASGKQRSRSWTLPAALLVLASLLAVAVLVGTERRALAPAFPVRLSVELGVDASLDVADEGAAAILSPDGSLLAFVARAKPTERQQIFLRRLDQLQATALPGTEGAHSPFFSPDGRSIGFFADSQLKRVAVSGGASVVLANAPTARGGTWAEDGTIFFTPNFMAGTGLSLVASSGGPTTIVTRPDAATGEVTHRWPQALAGGRAVLFTANHSVGGYDDASIGVLDVASGARKVVFKGGYHGRYLPSGHIVYVHEGTLFAIGFDLARRETSGAAVPVVQELVAAPSSAAAQFAFSERGTLVYMPGHEVPKRSIEWLDRSGRLSPLLAAPGHYRDLQLSPDGNRLAIQTFDGNGMHLWMYEWARDAISRLTFDATRGANPVWTPDGRGIAYTTLGGAQPGNIFWQRTDGTAPQPLTQSPDFQVASSWHPSGRFLAFQEMHAQTGYDVMILPIEGDQASGFKGGTPTPFLNGPFNEWQAVFSPNGRWLAYASNESGKYEIYVRPFPGPGGRWQVSTAGGYYPTWSSSHRELIYETLDQKLMAVSYTEQGDSFSAGKPWSWCETRVLETPGFRAFDLHPDGQRVALFTEVADPGQRRDKVVLVQNFFDELRRLAPVR